MFIFLFFAIKYCCIFSTGCFSPFHVFLSFSLDHLMFFVLFSSEKSSIHSPSVQVLNHHFRGGRVKTCDGTLLERKGSQKILGVQISDDLSWSRHCQEVCKKANSGMAMISKLEYVGVKIEDLIDIYILYIRSLTEYCSVMFHSSLTVEQSNRLERIQKTCLRVILSDTYID